MPDVDSILRSRAGRDAALAIRRTLDLWSDDALREEIDADAMALKCLAAALPVLLEAMEPSDEACKAAFEHWFCATGEPGWDYETEDIREDWREGMRKAYRTDFGAALARPKEQ